MIWWRVDPEISRRLSFARYALALLITAVAVPLVSFFLGEIISALFSPKSGPLLAITSAAYLGMFSIIVAWAYLLASVPLFFLARKSGIIGLFSTLVFAVGLSLPIPLFHMLNDPGVTWGNVMAIPALLAAYAILYGTTVWFICRKLHPHLFIQTPPHPPTAGP